MRQIFIGLTTEGTTDVEFLKPIIEKTLEKIAFECQGQIDIIVEEIKVSKKELSFVEHTLLSSKNGLDTFAMTALCIQADADGKTLNETYTNKIIPVINALNAENETEYCKILIPIVPIQETEAWLLADKDLLKKQIGTDKSDNDLGINREIESIANPKEVIQEAIRIARQDLTKKRRNDLNITDLYIIGSEIEIDKLEKLSSFQDFKENVRNAFRQLNLLQS